MPAAADRGCPPGSMFKKPFIVQATAKIKGSDLKKLRGKVLRHYNLDEETVEALLPSKVGKLQLDNKAYVYSTPDSKPVFLETDRGDVFPTLWTMWKYPQMAPSISIHAPVSPFVCGKGADVMLPGCAEENLGQFNAGDHRLLLVHHAYVGDEGQTVTEPGRTNPMPIAVGVMDVARDDIEDLKKGKAMRVIHYYGDQLWEFAGGGAPNAGFKDGVVDVWDGESQPEPEPEPDPELGAASEADTARAERVQKLGGSTEDDFGKKTKKKKKKDKSEETDEERRERKEKKNKKKKEQAVPVLDSPPDEPETEHTTDDGVSRRTPNKQFHAYSHPWVSGLWQRDRWA